MAFEALRGYLQLASGLTEVTRQRATASARALLASGSGGIGEVGDRLPAQVRDQVAALADDLLATGRSNRDLLLGLVRGEVERAVAGLGLVSAAELDVLRRELDAVSARVARLEVAAASTGATEGAASTKGAATTRAATRPAAAATPAGQQTATTRAATKRATTKATSKSTTKRAATKGAAAKRTTKGATTKGAAADATSSGAPRGTGSGATGATGAPGSEQ